MPLVPPTTVIAEGDALLRTERQICAEVADGIKAVRAMGRFSPQVLLLDIQMPGLNSLDGPAERITCAGAPPTSAIRAVDYLRWITVRYGKLLRVVTAAYITS